MTRLVVRIVLLFIGVVLISGCGASPSASSGGIDGVEVKVSGCDAGAFNAQPLVEIGPEKKASLGGLRGELELRKSGSCDRVYWIRFRPEKSNNVAYKLTIQVDKRHFQPQESEPGNPAIEAFTVGAVGRIGEKVTGCIDAGETHCIETVVV